VLKPLWEEAKRRAAKLERFEISHTLRGGNKEADRLANEAMDKGKQGSGIREQGTANQPATGVRANAYERPPKPPQQTFEGIVKDGVVHLIEGELPEGAMVKVTRQ
jgi:probable phosphoglycerate mutase